MKAIYFFLMIGIVACNQPSTNNIDKIPKDHTTIEKPVCSENEIKNPDQPEDPIIVRTCIWKGYKFMRTGSADNMGRYSWDYEVYRIMKDKTEISTKNSAIFSINQVELENFINKKVSEELAELKKNHTQTHTHAVFSSPHSHCFFKPTLTLFFQAHTHSIFSSPHSRCFFKPTLILFYCGLRINTLFCNYPTVEIGAESSFL